MGTCVSRSGLLNRAPGRQFQALGVWLAKNCILAKMSDAVAVAQVIAHLQRATTRRLENAVAGLASGTLDLQIVDQARCAETAGCQDDQRFILFLRPLKIRLPAYGDVVRLPTCAV